MENEQKVEKKTVAKKSPTKKSTSVKTKIDPKTGTLKIVEKKTTPKTTTKKSSSKTTTTKKTTTKKTTSTKKTTTTTKKPTAPKKSVVVVDDTPITPVVVVDETPITPIVVVDNEVKEEVPVVDTPINEEIVNETPKTETPKKRGRKPSENPLPKKSSRELTIEPPKREPKVEPKKEDKKKAEPEVIVRPTPKKAKNFTKEEKVLYKKLQEAFNYVANYTNVIEERTMDTKLIPDLTIGELHVIEMVDQNNNKPMTLVAKKMKVTVGSLTIAVNRLVQKGYLLRTRHEMDHRIILLSITPKGKKVLKIHDQFHENILGLVLDSLTLKQTLTVMNQFAMVLENYYDPKTIVPASKKKGSN